MLIGPFTLGLVALIVNMPLGKWRSYTSRFSPSWFVSVHLSIPFLVFLRFSWGLPTWVIPIEFAAAITGQLVGGKVNWLGLIGRGSHPTGGDNEKQKLERSREA